MPAVPSPDIAHRRAKVAGLARAARNGTRQADDPDLVAARSDLAEAKIRQFITKALASAPPLSSEQRDRLRALLEPARVALSHQAGAA
jgi:hypothetical protein